MKYLVKYFFLFSLLLFSFYYTNVASHLMINKSSLMKEIKQKASSYEKESTDAIIENGMIIPGQNGIKVDFLNSYYQMKINNYFDENKLVFQQVTPSLSIDNNKNLVIDKVRYQKRGIALVFYNNESILSFLQNNKLVITRLVDSSTFNKKTLYEQISIDKNTDQLLNKYKLNKNICFEDFIDKETCVMDFKYLVKSTYHVSNSLGLYKKIISGNIIYLEDTLNLSDFKLLLNKINSQDLKLYYLSDFISEKS